MRMYPHTTTLLVLIALAGCLNLGADTGGSVAPSTVTPKPKLIVYFDSYTPDMTWVQGIQKVIQEKFPEPKYLVRREHLNTKFYWSQDYLKAVKDILVARYRRPDLNDPLKPDIILASDDWAVSFLLSYRNDIFINQPPVVFCGVNERPITFTDPTKSSKDIIATPELLLNRRFTGFYENPGVKETLELIHKVHSKVKSVYVVTDSLEKTGLAWAKHVQAEKDNVKSMTCVINTLHAPKATLSEIETKIKEMTPEEDVILLGAYFSDPLRTVESYEKTTARICEVASKRKIAVYGMLAFHRDNGAWGGFELSGEGEAREMAAKALNILDSGSVDWTTPSELTQVKNRAGAPIPMFNPKSFKNYPAHYPSTIYATLHKMGYTDNMVKLGLKAPFSERIVDFLGKTAGSPWAWSLAGFMSWYLLIIIGAYKTPWLVFRAHCLTERLSAKKDLDSAMEKLTGWSATAIKTVLLMPFLLVRPAIVRWWLKDCQSNGCASLRTNQKIRTALEPAPLRVPFTVVDATSRRRYEGFDLAPIEELFQHNTASVLIYGRGGVGKSTLAFQIAEAAICGRVGSLPMVPVFIFGGDVNATATGVASDINSKIRRAVKMFGDLKADPPDSWVEYLCVHGHVICVIDGLSEMPKDYGIGVSNAILANPFPLNRVVITSRVIPSAFDGPRCEIDLLINDSLTGFIVGYLKRLGMDSDAATQQQLRDFLEVHWQKAFGRSPRPTFWHDTANQLGVKLANEYFGGFADCRSTAFFVRLRLQCAISNAPYQSLVELASHAIAEAHARSKPSTAFPTSNDAAKSFAHLAWHILAHGRKFCCDVFTRELACESLPGDDPTGQLDAFINDLGLVEVVDDTSGTLRFINDPIAEYLAPVGWSSLPNNIRKEGWIDLSNCARQLRDDKIYEMRGTIIGFYYYWLKLDKVDKAAWKWDIDLTKFDIRVDHRFTSNEY